MALQLLLDEHLGQKGRTIDKAIGNLVADGLPPRIQKALDSVRVIGNDSVHPGVIDTDDPATVVALFGLVNVIVEDRITNPKEVDLIYESLPESKRERIDQRDSGDE